jgi:diamine N-acetyltransferase
LQLIEITKENWEEAAKLTVREDQSDFITTNVWSIAESQYYPWTHPLGIVVDGRMIGFLVYGRRSGDGSWWLYRFMIERDSQGKGYGRAALELLLTKLRAQSDFDGITVGYSPENEVAERLYLRAGFVPGPPAPWGESTARYTNPDSNAER